MAAKDAPKPRKGRLKVFRTAIGFHDAYVAAPSRKAALEAWGTDKDLFARGVAEEVTDPALMVEPLASPGTVFRQLRSAPADLAAAPKRRKAAPEPAAKPRMLRSSPKPPPKPSRDDVEKARRALEATKDEQAGEERELTVRERELASERRAMQSRHAKELELLAERLAAAQAAYEERLEAWQEKVSRIGASSTLTPAR